MKELNAQLDLDAELTAMVKYISSKWQPLAGIEELFREIRATARHDARAMLDKWQVAELLAELEDGRAELLKANLATAVEQETAPLYDGCCHLLSGLDYKLSDVADGALRLDGGWNFGQREDALYARAQAKYPALPACRPLGWDALATRAHPTDALEEYSSAVDEVQFSGSRVEGTLSGNFVYRTSLPFALVEERRYGRSAAQSLVGAVYAHFLGCQQFLNGIRLRQAVDDLNLPLTQPTLVFDLKVPATDNPHLKVLLQLQRPFYSEAQYLESLASRAAYAALSEEEKARLEQESEADEFAAIAELKATFDETRKTEAAEVDKLMQLAFSR